MISALLAHAVFATADACPDHILNNTGMASGNTVTALLNVTDEGASGWN